MTNYIQFIKNFDLGTDVNENFKIYRLNQQNVFGIEDYHKFELVFMYGPSHPHFHHNQQSRFYFLTDGVMKVGRVCHTDDGWVGSLRKVRAGRDCTFRIVPGMAHAVSNWYEGEATLLLIYTEQGGRSRDQNGYPDGTVHLASYDSLPIPSRPGKWQYVESW